MEPPNGVRYAPAGYRWAGVDSAGEQKKLEARKLLEKAKESHRTSVRCVGRFVKYKASIF